MKLSRLLPPAVLLVLACAYFFNVLDGSSLLTERDLSVFFIPPRLLWTSILSAGEFPLWNPFSFCGHPLFATLQPGILYPPNILLLILPFDIGFNLVIVLHYFLAGLFTLLLLKEVGATRSGQMAGALTFMLSGYLFSVHNVLSTLLSVTWVPLAIFLYLRALRRGSFRYAAATAVVMAVMFTGGGIEVLLATFGLFALITIWPGLFDFDTDRFGSGIGMVTATPNGRQRVTVRVKLFIAACVLFVLISAVQLLPFAELASLSTRSGGLSYFEATTWSFDFKDFIQFFIPDLYGYGTSSEKYWANQSWLKTVYIGTLPLLLSLFFLLRYRARTLLFIFVGVLFFMLAMGRNSLIYPYLFEYLPFFGKIRYPVKFLFIPSVFLAIGAGLGLDAVMASMVEKRRMRYVPVLLLIIATVAALFFGYLSFNHADIMASLTERGFDYPEYNYAGINLFNLKRLLVFFIISALGLFAGFRSARFRAVLPLFIIILLSVDLFFAHNNYYGSTPAEQYHAPGTVIKSIKKDESLFRVFVTPKTLKEGALMPVAPLEEGGTPTISMDGERLAKEKLEGYNLEHGIYAIGGVNVMKRQLFAELYETVAKGAAIDSTNLLSLMNVKYVVSTPPIESDEFRLVHVVGMNEEPSPGEDQESGVYEDADVYEETETVKIYENLSNVPRYYLVEEFAIVPEHDKRLRIIASKDFTSSMVLLEENPWSDGYKAAMTTVASEPSVEVIDQSANSVELKVSATVPSILVTSDSWYPGWKVYVDGQKRPLLRANHAFKAVALSDGTHRVRFVFAPKSFYLGAVVSTVTLLGLLFLFFYRRNNRKGFQ
jgi:hypothetical protein